MTPVEHFEADYFVSNRLSPMRRIFVLHALKEFEAFGGRPLLELTDQELMDFSTFLVGTRGLHVNTVRKYLNAIKPFYKWAWKRRLTTADHYMRIGDVSNPRGATGNARPRPYKPLEVEEFWADVAARYPKTMTKLQLTRMTNRTTSYPKCWQQAARLQTSAIASLALYGGLRAGEIYGAKLAELHPDNAYILVRGKTDIHEEPKLREVPFTVVGREHMAEWLEYRKRLFKLRRMKDHGKPWLVLTPSASMNNRVPSDPLNPMSIKGFARVLTAVGPWELHRFRHTAATEWLRAGVKIEQVSKLLGHATIQQTLCYAQISRDDVARSMMGAEDEFVKRVGRRHDQVKATLQARAA